ncbi:type III-B CRISPR-associated protein Cas10/Cmr2 [Anabaena sp. PCC 7108]|uniref:Cas10/Cmr2 second palm domain-containing protein n=1 Tax=Anabaena sp. PCC 7108 TaxID=163908 RepID=UPI000345C60B|nr:type III-B CRISPR-associated protein Cas10/Cmr2 [Anabaena sp. PCC 7108]
MSDEAKYTYTAITFAPVQGFIEKSRKLRDLYGASLILSYLSQQIVIAAHKPPETTVISPANINVQKGMPNRILIKGHFPEDIARQELLTAWEDILFVCRNWIETKLSNYKYEWKREWGHWGNYTWEIFWGQGDSIANAMEDLETRKLSRDWTAINWIGESSSLTGTDGIAFPGLGGELPKSQNLEHFHYRKEDSSIKPFYEGLERITNEVIDSTEKLSIPELTKRLVTWYEVREKISQRRHQNKPFEELEENFSEIQRKPTIKEKITESLTKQSESEPGQWTGWFIGDGDKVGNKLKEIAKNYGEQGIRDFTLALRNWGEDFYNNFAEQDEIGRVIYAGGDDFLGVIYSKNVREPIPGLTALEWLMTLNDKWKENGQGISVSVGFVWVAGSVPQRDVLQHCRQAQDTAKSLKRDRVTIRIVFNSGQYVEWTCPWQYLHILKAYKDRKGNTYPEWEHKGRDSKYEPNWTHIYSDLAQLKSRHAFGLGENRRRQEIDKDNTAKQSKIIDYRRDFLEFFDIYFPGYKDILKSHEKLLVGASDDASSAQKALLMIDWIEDLITIGWHLCSNTNTSSSLDH